MWQHDSCQLDLAFMIVTSTFCLDIRGGTRHRIIYEFLSAIFDVGGFNLIAYHLHLFMIIMTKESVTPFVPLCRGILLPADWLMHCVERLIAIWWRDWSRINRHLVSQSYQSIEPEHWLLSTMYMYIHMHVHVNVQCRCSAIVVGRSMTWAYDVVPQPTLEK